MDGFEIVDPRFRHYILGNASLEQLATGFRWIEGLVWMGDWNCLLFEDLPRNRIMRWSEADGVSIYREPSNYTNGQTRDRQGRLISCSHRGRCLYRTEHDGRVVTLVDRHDGRRLNAPNDVAVKSDGTIWFTDPLYGISNDYEGGRQTIGTAACALSPRSREWGPSHRRRRFRRSKRPRVFAGRIPAVCRRNGRSDHRQPETVHPRVRCRSEWQAVGRRELLRRSSRAIATA